MLVTSGGSGGMENTDGVALPTCLPGLVSWRE